MARRVDAWKDASGGERRGKGQDDAGTLVAGEDDVRAQEALSVFNLQLSH